jgi:hypothetical protein
VNVDFNGDVRVDGDQEIETPYEGEAENEND